MKKNKREFSSARRTAAAVLAAAMLCTPVLAGQASAAAEKSTDFTTSELTKSIPQGAKVSSAAAAAAVRKLFPELTPDRVTTAEYSADYESDHIAVKSWRLTYTLPGSEDDSASATVDAVSGIVVDAYTTAFSARNTDPELTRDKAAERALAFLLRALPDKKASDFAGENESDESADTITPLFGSPDYSFWFLLKVNGVPSRSETLTVSVDRAGNVTAYTRGLSRLPYPSAVPKIAADKAREAFASAFGAKLAYIPSGSLEGALSGYYLGYAPSDASLAPIDASDGERLDPTTGLPYASAAAPEGEAVKSAASAPPEPLKTEEAARQRIEKLGLIPQGYKLSSQQTHTQDYPKKGTEVWVLDFRSVVKGRTNSINVQLDAATGQIYNYYFFDQAGQGASGAKAEAPSKARAAAWAAKLLPNAEKWRLVSAPQKGDPILTYGFQRYENGLPVLGDTASATFDAQGALTEYYVNEPSLSVRGSFPSPDAVKISAAEAKAKFLEATELGLYYNRFGRPTSGASNAGTSEMKLTYLPMLKSGSQLSVSNVLDASDGSWKTLNGPDASGHPSDAASDIAGHENEAALKEMLDHGVLTLDAAGKANPDARLTRGEWADMLARAMQPDYSVYDAYTGMALFRDVDVDSPYQAALGYLAGQNWVTPNKLSDFKPEAELTRDGLAHLLMGVLNYDKLAGYYNSAVDLPGIADSAAIEHKGDAALAMKLGLLPAVNGSFLPEKAVTRADAAFVLSKLADLQGKTDTFMNWNSW
ncbi:YcdB/YcdC domain-containing protein [Saccharibacillus alkalitolerans]|uniref:YcdB/YcdC repeated domain-containing protein n=1 Tax=Saccharibacillus alkalitolerans TaxID=2705290 RepID=A0ABX0F5P0_9BACL|nr:YcdB/YcdC domain-containing protein [Saccharibacillus alkalitolerans]NGZ74928.1 hypothetical protein [Saccharibacillus alkalitolerans]